MRYYDATVHKEKGRAFGVHFPELPGCFSAANRHEELIANATEALALWFEGSDHDDEARPRFSQVGDFSA